MPPCLAFCTSSRWAIMELRSVLGTGRSARLCTGAVRARIESSATTSHVMLWLWLEGQRHAIHAVAFACRARTVGKQVAKMPAAARAVDLHARHAVAAIGRRLDGAFEGPKEAGPARAALELRIRREERLSACSACERAGSL